MRSNKAPRLPTLETKFQSSKLKHSKFGPGNCSSIINLIRTIKLPSAHLGLDFAGQAIQRSGHRCRGFCDAKAEVCFQGKTTHSRGNASFRICHFLARSSQLSYAVRTFWLGLVGWQGPHEKALDTVYIRQRCLSVHGLKPKDRLERGRRSFVTPSKYHCVYLNSGRRKTTTE